MEASRRFFAPCFDGRSAPQLWVAHVDDRTRCIHLASYVADGADRLPVGSIIADAKRLDSAGLVIAQARAAGASFPTSFERASTCALSRAAEAIDVTLLDHLVFAGSACSSFRRMGLL